MPRSASFILHSISLTTIHDKRAHEASHNPLYDHFDDCWESARGPDDNRDDMLESSQTNWHDNGCPRTTWTTYAVGMACPDQRVEADPLAE